MGKCYLNRKIDDIIEEKLDMVGAIVIIGPKWCGKTTTAQQHSKTIVKLQDPDTFESYKELVSIKPSLILKGEKPVLIDEWQDLPVIWDAVRTSVDNLREDGLYILTGSTVIDESLIKHSGTGRFNRLIMRTMSLYESGESNGKISINDLFNNPNMDIDGIKSDLTIEKLIFAACRGGWPESLNKKSIKAQLFVAENYIKNICETDASKIDGHKKDPKKVKKILEAYARNISTIASKKTLLSDVRGSYPEMTNSTFNTYLDSLNRLFVIEDMSAWNPNIRSKTAIRSTPKREFTDPSIAVAALNLTPDLLIQDLSTFGFIFETLCIRDLLVYSSGFDGEVSYFRDRYGLEADCVLHLKNGDYALIEFKLGNAYIDEGAKHLLKLKNILEENINEKNLKMKKPKFLAIITGTEFAYTRKDGVKVIPIGCLKD